jgi:hypothetical protein
VDVIDPIARARLLVNDPKNHELVRHGGLGMDGDEGDVQDEFTAVAIAIPPLPSSVRRRNLVLPQKVLDALVDREADVRQSNNGAPLDRFADLGECMLGPGRNGEDAVGLAGIAPRDPQHQLGRIQPLPPPPPGWGNPVEKIPRPPSPPDMKSSPNVKSQKDEESTVDIEDLPGDAHPLYRQRGTVVSWGSRYTKRV